MMKVERLKKIEMASDMDEILKEEIREYKETLTCPSCKVGAAACCLSIRRRWIRQTVQQGRPFLFVFKFVHNNHGLH